MGTNYYHYEQTPCACCGRPFESKHIGKSSAGWVFGLHVSPEDGIHDLPDWEARWTQGEIKNEYGAPITPEQMKEIITKREWTQRNEPFGYQSWEQFHQMNESIPGPKNLLRHRLGSRCVKHGEGTWDCITGEFS